MTDRYENIRLALAMGPTPGPWELKDGRTDTVENAQGYPVCTVHWHPDERYGHGVRAAYIAACDPDTIRELLAERDRLAAALEAAQMGLRREESDHERTIDQRDAAEDALSRMFQAVTGRPAEWSSAWGYVDAIEEVEEHVAALEAAREDASIERRALLWLAGGDSGKSSEAICHHMLGMESDGSFPWDPSDLGRCLRLLERFPEWKPRMGEMARYSAQWAALVERWDELAEMMADEVGIDWSKGKRAPLTYAAMKDAIDQARGKGGQEVGK